MQRIIALLTLALALAFGGGTAFADEKTDKKLEDCRKVFESFTDLSEQSVPVWMLERAYGIVVIPQVIKGAVFFGGRGGRGCMAVRNADGSWSNPVFVMLGGGRVRRTRLGPAGSALSGRCSMTTFFAFIRPDTVG